MNSHLKRLKTELDKTGLLMLSDAALPSLTTLVAGAPVKGSWWGHPQGNAMYNLSHQLEDLPGVLSLKLVNKKVTYVEKRHWDALFAMGTSGQEWQTVKLLAAHERLIESVQKEGELRADDPRLKLKTAEVSKLVSKLEERLLLHSESVHTESGKHVRVMRTWKELMRSKGHAPKKMTAAAAEAHFAEVAAKLAEASGAKVGFPWA